MRSPYQWIASAIVVTAVVAAGPNRAVLADTVVVQLGSSTGDAGQTVSIATTLQTGGESVASVEADIGFEPLTPIAITPSFDPDCQANPAINKNLSGFAFLPPGCTYGVDCTGVRGLILGLNTDPIPDGSALFDCHVDISVSATAGVYPLSGSNCSSSDPFANALPTICSDGAITVAHPSLDHFKCYKIKKDHVVFPPTAVLADQFSTETVDIKKAFLWCNPVSTNGGPINDPDDHLLCYKIKGQNLLPAPHLSTTNQFGTSTLFAKKPYLLCVPGSAAILP